MGFDYKTKCFKATRQMLKASKGEPESYDNVLFI